MPWWWHPSTPYSPRASSAGGTPGSSRRRTWASTSCSSSRRLAGPPRKFRPAWCRMPLHGRHRSHPSKPAQTDPRPWGRTCLRQCPFSNRRCPCTRPSTPGASRRPPPRRSPSCRTTRTSRLCSSRGRGRWPGPACWRGRTPSGSARTPRLDRASRPNWHSCTRPLPQLPSRPGSASPYSARCRSPLSSRNGSPRRHPPASRAERRARPPPPCR
mmetsp:Transcript_6128/g.14110  ORF Transcript_6128/g.14110 Transcript_6128/m.14110 type:complete len:214 (-) Transcript_6128:657-1298(-)